MPQADVIGTSIGKINMKCLKYAFSLVIILITSVRCYGTVQIQESWWLTVKLDAKHTELNGLPVNTYNKNWRFANFIGNSNLIEKIDKNRYQNFIKSSFEFKKEYDINNNGINETIQVGIYKDRNDNEGIFLAIFEKDNLIKAFTDSSHKNFSVLLINDKQLLWYRCMECGNYEKLLWTGKTYVLE